MDIIKCLLDLLDPITTTTTPPPTTTSTTPPPSTTSTSPPTTTTTSPATTTATNLTTTSKTTPSTTMLLLMVVVPLVMANPTGSYGDLETWRDSPLLSGDSEDYCRYACDGKGGCITTYTGAPSSLWQTEGSCTVGEVWEECVERGECEECFNIPTTCMQCNQVVACTGDSTEVVPHLASWWEGHRTEVTETYL